MGWRKRRRQILLFLTAILLPAAVLVSLAVRVFRQETELADSRIADDRRDAVEQLRRELTARLEAIKLQELNRLIREPRPAVNERRTDSAIVFSTALDGSRLILPWESDRNAAKPTPQFTRLRQEGESLEFFKNDPLGGMEVYRIALAGARDQAEGCEAQLLIGRTLMKTQMTDAALSLYRLMLKECGSEADSDGIPYRMYAAQRLMETRPDSEDAVAARAYIVGEVNSGRWLAPLQAYMIRSMLSSAPGTLVTEIHDIEQTLALSREFPRVLARVEPTSEASPLDSVWLAFGDEPWLITVTSPAPPLSSFVLAVSSHAITPPGARLIAGQAPGSVSLGEPFPGLAVEWQPGRFATRGVPLSLYATGLTLILGVTILGGYLLLRDVNREVQMAEMRSHFVASVSHELKTPLTAIRMFAETLVMGRASDPRTSSEYMQTIVNESERLSRLVDNVLDFSRIEQGNKIYRMKPTDLDSVVRSAARAMQYPLAQQGFTLDVGIDDELPPVPADADAMEQAILNLLTNAMKYSGDSRRIELHLSRRGAEAAIDVADRGLGIAPEDQPRIFDKFYRVRSASSDLVAGTGLGLTLVMHIANAHGGRVEVQSAVGKGSTFSLRIPLEMSEAHA